MMSYDDVVGTRIIFQISSTSLAKFSIITLLELKFLTPIPNSIQILESLYRSLMPNMIFQTLMSYPPNLIVGFHIIFISGMILNLSVIM